METAPLDLLDQYDDDDDDCDGDDTCDCDACIDAHWERQRRLPLLQRDRSWWISEGGGYLLIAVIVGTFAALALSLIF